MTESRDDIPNEKMVEQDGGENPDFNPGPSEHRAEERTINPRDTINGGNNQKCEFGREQTTSNDSNVADGQHRHVIHHCTHGGTKRKDCTKIDYGKEQHSGKNRNGESKCPTLRHVYKEPKHRNEMLFHSYSYEYGDNLQRRRHRTTDSDRIEFSGSTNFDQCCRPFENRYRFEKTDFEPRTNDSDRIEFSGSTNFDQCCRPYRFEKTDFEKGEPIAINSGSNIHQIFAETDQPEHPNQTFIETDKTEHTFESTDSICCKSISAQHTQVKHTHSTAEANSNKFQFTTTDFNNYKKTPSATETHLEPSFEYAVSECNNKRKRKRHFNCECRGSHDFAHSSKINSKSNRERSKSKLRTRSKNNQQTQSQTSSSSSGISSGNEGQCAKNQPAQIINSGDHRKKLVKSKINSKKFSHSENNSDSSESTNSDFKMRRRRSLSVKNNEFGLDFGIDGWKDLLLGKIKMNWTFRRVTSNIEETNEISCKTDEILQSILAQQYVRNQSVQPAVIEGIVEIAES